LKTNKRTDTSYISQFQWPHKTIYIIKPWYFTIHIIRIKNKTMEPSQLNQNKPHVTFCWYSCQRVFRKYFKQGLEWGTYCTIIQSKEKKTQTMWNTQSIIFQRVFHKYFKQGLEWGTYCTIIQSKENKTQTTNLNYTSY